MMFAAWFAVILGCLLGTMSRPIFVGNFEYDTRQSELERLFSKYGRIERVDMKSGMIFCFNEFVVTFSRLAAFCKLVDFFLFQLVQKDGISI